jgi:hypothetical protein
LGDPTSSLYIQPVTLLGAGTVQHSAVDLDYSIFVPKVFQLPRRVEITPQFGAAADVETSMISHHLRR